MKLSKKKLDNIKKGLEEGKPFAQLANAEGVEQGEGRFKELFQLLKDEFGEEINELVQKRKSGLPAQIENAKSVEEIDQVISRINLLMAKAQDKRNELSES